MNSAQIAIENIQLLARQNDELKVLIGQARERLVQLTQEKDNLKRTGDILLHLFQQEMQRTEEMEELLRQNDIPVPGSKDNDFKWCYVMPPPKVDVSSKVETPKIDVPSKVETPKIDVSSKNKTPMVRVLLKDETLGVTTKKPKIDDSNSSQKIQWFNYDDPNRYGNNPNFGSSFRNFFEGKNQ
jgi:hypothetical protein